MVGKVSFGVNHKYCLPPSISFCPLSTLDLGPISSC